ncbi:hypothetical protein LTR10_021415 [Elasticomyces elasticus]|nr:hypothetical protein LTR10_021415 [Elasticomyces elasticus]
MDDDRASDGGFTETDDNNSIMTPASDGTEMPKTANTAANANTATAAQPATAQSSSLESQVQDLFTITNNLQEQLTTQTQANEQLKAELATTRAELATSIALQQGVSQTLKAQHLAAEAQHEHVRTLRELVHGSSHVLEEDHGKALATKPEAALVPQKADASSPATLTPQLSLNDIELAMKEMSEVILVLVAQLSMIRALAFTPQDLFEILGSIIYASTGDAGHAAFIEYRHSFIEESLSTWDEFAARIPEACGPEERQQVQEDLDFALDIDTDRTLNLVAALKRAILQDGIKNVNGEPKASDTNLKEAVVANLEMIRKAQIDESNTRESTTLDLKAALVKLREDFEDQISKQLVPAPPSQPCQLTDLDSLGTDLATLRKKFDLHLP